MGQAISKLTIKGYKSIRSLENFELRNLNILIGPNGAGKSNFLSFFRLLEEIIKDDTAIKDQKKSSGYRENLERYVKYMGGADKIFYLGTKETKKVEVELFHDSIDTDFHFSLLPTSDDRLDCQLLTGTGLISRDVKDLCTEIDNIIDTVFRGYAYYHFNDTSDFAAVKKPCSKRDYEYLRTDASNLAAFLLFLRKKHEKDYQYLREVVQLAAPFFGDFLLRDSLDNPDETLLEWRQKASDYPFHPSQISDGTLRFICLATALLQPNTPSTILLDEPELGLHPYALNLLAGLIQKAAARTQVIVSTQSAALIDNFEPEDIIVVERKNGESVFSRPDTEKLKIWLEDYSLGEIWCKNIIGGRPTHE
jgi:predicted ATPase